MLSDHLRKFDEIPYKTLLIVAAGLVILCQLAALAFVADSQVAKAKLRESQRVAQMQAIAQCMDAYSGCMLLALPLKLPPRRVTSAHKNLRRLPKLPLMREVAHPPIRRKASCPHRLPYAEARLKARAVRPA
jgi:hypothetical protein